MKKNSEVFINSFKGVVKMTSNPIRKVREITDLKDMLEQSAKLFDERDAFWIKTENGDYKGVKYTEFKNEVDALGSFSRHGAQDKYIAVIGENRYEWCLSYLAVVNGTGIVVPLDRSFLAEIENLLIRSDASAILFSGKHEKDMLHLAAVLPSIKYL